jgi:hypothetical protein
MSRPTFIRRSGALTLPQTSNSLASSFLIIRSTQDSSLPNGRTVCSHGIQDNLATSTDPGLDNADCTGANMYFQNGVLSAPITAASESGTTATITSTLNPGVNSVASAVNLSPMAVSGKVNTSGTAVTWVSGNNFSTIPNGIAITINGVIYTVSTVNSSTSLTLTTSAGTQTSVTYSTQDYNETFVVTASNSTSFQYTAGSGLTPGTGFGTATVGNITTIAPGAFTLANGTATNTSN